MTYSAVTVACTAARAVVAVAGGYGVVHLAIVATASALARGGLAPSDAVVAAAMLGFPAYLGVLLWALACPRLLRLAGVLGLAAAGCAAAGWWLQPGMPA
ncbi:ketohydroxyglutarate aldolase [Paracidovorax avenae]|uniref:ketohydroxyglutarate aldolase n=1 Tax=Paracidovorax avenae TaxID=80867 RepID=UPI000D21DA0E|nr:ketohydroxyglutarate aldolase [Paracidovorax avenae]AVS64646.1 ketohydroxyglutarate aldolase [Paracidovorax avenae]